MKRKYIKFISLISLIILSFGFIKICSTEYNKEFYIIKIINFENSQISSVGIPHLFWGDNGTPICTRLGDQNYPQICSDMAGGAIIAWYDGDIYAQRINSTGHDQWTLNGTTICTANQTQENCRIVSDGAGGAIITWQDMRSGTNSDIYAQRINSTGDIQWTANGTVICNATGNQEYPKICSDENGGAIITWEDQRGSDEDIYVQHINSTGFTQWTNNGLQICTEVEDQSFPTLCSDGNGGAIVTWSDKRFGLFFEEIYAQRVNSTGHIQWADNGTAICTEDGFQYWQQIFSDETGGAIIIWLDRRSGTNYDLYMQRINSSGQTLWADNGTILCNRGYDAWVYENGACSDGAGGWVITWQDFRGAGSDIYTQRINSSGHSQWTPNGTVICNEIRDQATPKICSNGSGGWIITWWDRRKGDPNDDIYVQLINSTGHSQWDFNGLAVCTEVDRQFNVELTSDGRGGAILTWMDHRISSYDIYAHRVKSVKPPISNDPENITTPITGLETINWTLWDREGSGKYRVWANDTNNNYYVWLNWTDWGNNSNLQVSINYTSVGIFNYTIEYNNSVGLFGVPDTVLVTITATQNPTSNQPSDIITSANGTETINWTLYDDIGAGKYRVWANDTNDNYYIWQNWAPWTNDTNLNVTINRTAPGIYNYTIVYNDSTNQFGIPNMVIVNITNGLPASNNPNNITTTAGGSETINWTLYDDFGPGQYRLWANNTNNNYYVWVDWTSWFNNTLFNIPINRSASGVYNYTIEYYDMYNLFGNPDTVIVNITNGMPTSDNPNNITTSAAGIETINWTLYDDFGPGQYRVWANDTNDNYYILVDWTPWFNNTLFSIQINRTAPGIYNYTIEYFDNDNEFGVPDTVIVTITDGMPSCNTPNDVNTTTKGSETIDWILYDDFGPGKYQVWVNDTNNNYYILINWTDWINNTIISIPINRTAIGIFNYTIEFNSSTGQFSIDTVIVNITMVSAPHEPPIPLFPIQETGILAFLLSPIGFVIIGSIAAGVAISLILISKKRPKKVKKEKQEKLPINWPFKDV